LDLRCSRGGRCLRRDLEALRQGVAARRLQLSLHRGAILGDLHRNPLPGSRSIKLYSIGVERAFADRVFLGAMAAAAAEGSRQG